MKPSLQSSNLFRWSQDYKDLPFTVIPPAQNEKWLSPWDALTTDFSNDQTPSAGHPLG